MLRERLEALRENLKAEDWLVLAAVWALPWCFGGGELWAHRSAAFLLVCAGGVLALKTGFAAVQFTRAERWLLPSLLLPLVACFQLLPLPPSVLKYLSPRAVAIHQSAFPGDADRDAADPLRALERAALQRSDEQFDLPPLPVSEERFLQGVLPAFSRFRPLSLEPAATAERLFWYLALLAAFVVVRRRAADETRAHYYRMVVFALLASLALQGLLQLLFANGKLLWVREPLAGGRPFGPYVNRTHFAGVMELATPWLLASFLEHLRRAGVAGLRDARTVLPGLGALLCGLAAVAAASKAAVVLIGAAVASVTLLGVPRGRRTWVVVAWAAAAFVAGAILYRTELGQSYRDLMTAAAGDISAVDRIVAWQTCLDIVRAFPLWGCGFGAFGEVFPVFMPAGEPLMWDHAHNDYLQVLVEGGLVAFSALGWLAFGYGVRVFRRLRSPQGSGLAQFGLGVGLLSLSLHALVDFNHQIPANALLFVVLAAMALPAQEGPSAASGKVGSFVRAALPRRRLLATAAVAGAVAWFGVRAGIGVASGYAYAAGARAAARGDYDRARDLLPRAIAGANVYPAAWLLGEVELGLWDRSLQEQHPTAEDEARALRDVGMRAAAAYLRALRAAPSAGYPWDGLAALYHRIEQYAARGRPIELSWVLGDRRGRVGYAGRVALGLLLLAGEGEPNNYRHYDQLLDILLDYGLQEEALWALERAARAQPDYLVHERLRQGDLPAGFRERFYEVSSSLVGKAPLLGRAQHLFSLGRLAQELGRIADAEQLLRRAFPLAESQTKRCEIAYHLARLLLEGGRGEAVQVWLAEAERCEVFVVPALLLKAEVAEKDGRGEEALRYLREALQSRPQDVGLILRYARTAQALGHQTAAEEALHWATVVAPTDVRAYERLIELHLAQGDAASAVGVFNRMQARFGDSYELEAVRRAIERAYGVDLQQL